MGAILVATPILVPLATALLLAAIRSPEQVARHTAAQACAEVAAHCGVAHRKPQDLWQQIASSNRTLETPSSHQPAQPEPKHHPAATPAPQVSPL